MNRRRRPGTSATVRSRRRSEYEHEPPHQSTRPRRALPEKTRHIKAWVRDLRGLDDRDIVSITELACREDGCPDIETVIGIMRPGKPIETIRVHKAIADIARQDFVLP